MRGTPECVAGRRGRKACNTRWTARRACPLFVAYSPQTALRAWDRLAPPDVLTKLLKVFFWLCPIVMLRVTPWSRREQRVQMIKGDTDLSGLKLAATNASLP